MTWARAIAARSHHLRQGLVAACVLACQPAAFADDLPRQFSSELLLHESRQVLETGKPLRYADGEAGAALRRLLDPDRAVQVLDSLDEATRRGAAAPDLHQQMKPLLQRYARAFERWPGEYEAEYLDSLHWIVQTMKRSLAQVAAAAAVPAGEQPAMRQLLVNSRGLLIGVTGLLEREIHNKIAANAFSPAGGQRASMLAGELARARGELVAVKMRLVYGGRDAYERHCAVCHTTGVAGAPRLGDRADWQRRSRGGFEALVQSTLRGKGAMPPQSGGDLQDVELARAAAYLANSGGASFPEPELSADHPGIVRVEEMPPPPRAPQPAVRLAHGEQVYAINCAACHQQGQQSGPFPALRGGEVPAGQGHGDPRDPARIARHACLAASARRGHRSSDQPPAGSLRPPQVAGGDARRGAPAAVRPAITGFKPPPPRPAG